MSFDDRLRDAFERSAPAAPDAPRARGELGAAMTRARRNHRIRRGIAATTLSLAVAGGGVAGALQVIGDDDVVDTRTSTLPPPEVTLPPPETVEPDATTTTAPSTSVAPAATTTPSTTAPPPGSSAPPTTTSFVDVADTLSGPHVTPCGSVTFVVNTVVTVDSRTIEPGYLFSTEGDGSTEVHAKWLEGPGDECQVEAKLDYPELEIDVDED